MRWRWPNQLARAQFEFLAGVGIAEADTFEGPSIVARMSFADQRTAKNATCGHGRVDWNANLFVFFHFSVSLAAFRPRPCRWFCTSAQVLRSRPNRIQPAWLLFDRVGVGKEWANFFPWKDFSPDYFLDVSRVQRVEMKLMNVSISNMSEAS